MTGYQCSCFRAKTGLSQTDRLKTRRYSLSHFFLAKSPSGPIITKASSPERNISFNKGFPLHSNGR